MKTKLIIGGTYRHYKGHVYRVIGLAKHSETFEELVVYQEKGKDENIWARPKEMFLDYIESNSVEAPRFKLLKEDT